MADIIDFKTMRMDPCFLSCGECHNKMFAVAYDLNETVPPRLVCMLCRTTLNIELTLSEPPEHD